MNKWSRAGLVAGVDTMRRRLLGAALAGGGAAALAVAGGAHAKAAAGSSKHKVVYQFNKADADYHQHVTFSAGEMVRKYGKDVQVVVVCFGPGIHILAHFPQRPVSEQIQQQVAKLAESGVEFHACNNTMKALGWTEDDLLPFAQVVDVGAADLMELQEQGFSYISW